MARTVTVGRRIKALSEPNFLIRDSEGRIYLTVAVLEYDERATKNIDEMVQGVKAMKQLFDGSAAEDGLSVRRVQPRADRRSMSSAMVGIQTGPPGIQTN